MKILKKIPNRIIIVGFLIALQVIWFLVFVYRLSDHSLAINLTLKGISILAAIYVVGTNMNPATKLAWVIPILTFPLLGGLLYLFFCYRKPTKPLRLKLEASDARLRPYIDAKEEHLQELKLQDKSIEGQARYIRDLSGYPIYTNTQAYYYPSGEETFPVLLEELEKAEHFIFLEYFIIREGIMWSRILEILKEKAGKGLDVRLMYDDVGSLNYLPFRYERELETYGIKCEAFNHFVPLVSAVMNHRDHRKIAVIDGHTAFTGGINFGDEYINVTKRYGYWKDNGIMLKGEAVWSLTAMFLSMWNGIRPTDMEFQDFQPHVHHPQPFSGSGYVQPYCDTPLEDENVGENVYLNMIHAAQDYIKILNPYVILDNELLTAMCLAAKRGVDIRLIIPGISDSKIVGWLADSYYVQLIKQGVKVYKYNPGFMHSKVFLCDDKVATVGSFNLDYRSLYLHFECGVFLYRTDSIHQICEEVKEVLEESTLLSLEECTRPLPFRVFQKLLKVIEPLI